MGRLLRHVIPEVKIVTRKIQKSNRPIKTDKLSTFFKNLTKGKLRCTFDESYFHESGVDLEDQLWYEQITANNGFAYLLSYKEELLGFYCGKKMGNIILSKMDDCHIHIETDAEYVITFHKSLLWDLDKVVHFRRKRQMTDEQKEVSRKRLIDYNKSRE